LPECIRVTESVNVVVQQIAQFIKRDHHTKQLIESKKILMRTRFGEDVFLASIQTWFCVGVCCLKRSG